ncbi:hypothetical protein, partial [Burkholderia pseudomallei]|uniref:hypothetical protein n=1 Tax=Burkholderia pseudomallei TaxID=28450 RepID=UPI0021F7B274
MEWLLTAQRRQRLPHAVPLRRRRGNGEPAATLPFRIGATARRHASPRAVPHGRNDNDSCGECTSD